MTEQQIKDRLAELYKAQEAATGWGAAVGARHEEIKSLEGQLAAIQRPFTGTAELVAAALRHADGLTAQLAKPDWKPGRAHIEQARNSIKKLANILAAAQGDAANALK